MRSQIILCRNGPCHGPFAALLTILYLKPYASTLFRFHKCSTIQYSKLALRASSASRSIPRTRPPFLTLFFSWLIYFSGKGDASQKKFSPWSFTSKRFHQKIPTRLKVMGVSKGSTSGATYFLSTWFQRVFMRLQLLSNEKGA